MIEEGKDMIRQASVADIPRLIDLLHQVDMVHHRLRPEGNDSAIRFYQNMGMHPQKIGMEIKL